MTTNRSNLDYIRAHQYLYYCTGFTVISDYEYDRFGVWSGEDYKGGSDSEGSYTKDQIALAKGLTAHNAFPKNYPNA